MNPKLLIVSGPTSSGKTQIGIELAQKYNGEIVSADSRQVYKGMDIGTGKDLPKNGIPIWLIDIVPPDYMFNLADYVRFSRIVIKDIWKRKKLPVVVGGTGLYIESLLKPLNLVNIPRDDILRQKLEKLKVNDLINILKKRDTSKWESMNISDKNNPRRLIRAIEIVQSKNKNINEFLPSDFLMIYLKSNLPILYKRIDKRVDSRVKEGIVSEIEKLVKSGFSFELPAFSAFPYRFFKSYFNGLNSDEELNKIIAKWKFEEHALARRQVTWFKKMINQFPQEQSLSIDITSPDLISKIVARVTKWYTDV